LSFRHHIWLRRLALLLTAFFWGYAFIGIKIALKYLPPFQLAFIRFFLASLLALALILTFKSKKASGFLKGLNWGKVFLISFFGMGGYHLSLNAGEVFTSPSLASLIVFTSPVFTLGLSHWYLKERIGWNKFLGVILAFTGVFWLYFFNSELKSSVWWGPLVILLAPLSWSIYTVFSKPLLQKYDPLLYSLLSLVLGTLQLLPLILFFPLSPYLFLIKLNGWIQIFILAGLCSFFGTFAWIWGLSGLSPTEISLYLYFIPIFTIIFEWLIFKKPVGLSLIIGALLIFFGVGLAEKGNW